jgi:GT2 family glycosyltransferase
MPRSIDVVIPVRDRFDLTERCLRHLQAQTVEHKVIVVDDGSTDGTAERLREHWRAVHVERLASSRGFAELCNRGAAAGSGEIIILLNNDVECRPDFLERVIAPFADPQVGAVASLMLQPGEALIDSIGLSADVTLAAFPRLQGRPAQLADRDVPRLACPAGAAAAYRRSAWVQAGGLDETMHAYMEEFELGLRLLAAGWRAVAAPAAAGVHLGSATHGHRSSRQRYYGGFSRGYLLRRYGVLRGRHALRAVLTEAIVVVGDLLISRDLAAAHGRVTGWRTGARLPRLAPPPADAIESRIGFRRSLRLRLGVYGRRAA